MNTTIRPFWNGVPVELETVWTLAKRDRVARCVLLSHELGWELRIDSGDLLLTQVCRSDQEIEDVSAAWKAAMIEKGWHDTQKRESRVQPLQPTPIDAIKAKLDRATQHIADLSSRLDTFLSEAPERELVDCDADAAKAFRDFHLNRPIPPEFGIVAGEVIHQLRSSLDHIACALHPKDGGTPTITSQFPIFSFEPTKPDDGRRYQNQIKGITRPAVLALIEHHQPYLRGNDRHWLVVLKTLSNTDKHRALIVNVTYYPF